MCLRERETGEREKNGREGKRERRNKKREYERKWERKKINRGATVTPK